MTNKNTLPWIVGAVLVILLGIYFAMMPSKPVTYVNTVSDEVSALESDLAGLDAQIKAGELTVEEAAAARDKIAERLNTIYSTIDASKGQKVPPELRDKLQQALSNLSDILTQYADTLVAVDVLADPEVLPNVSEEDVLQAGFRNMGYEYYRGSASAKKKSLIAQAATTLQALESNVTETGGESTVSDDVWNEFGEFVDDSIYADAGTSSEESMTEEQPTMEEEMTESSEEKVAEEEPVMEETQSGSSTDEQMTEEGTTEEAMPEATSTDESAAEMTESTSSEEMATSSEEAQ